MPRVAAAPLGVLIGLPIAACFSKPPGPAAATADAQVGSDSGGITDAHVLDAPDGNVPPGACATDEFTGAPAAGCGTLALQVSPIATAGNGALTLSVPLNDNFGGRAACVTPLRASRSFTINLNAFAPDDHFTELSVFVDVGATRYRAAISGANLSQTIRVECGDAVMLGTEWNLSLGRYVRLAWHTATSLTIEMAGSASGMYTEVGSCGVAPAATHASGVELRRGTNGNAQQAAIDSVEICP